MRRTPSFAAHGLPPVSQSAAADTSALSLACGPPVFTISKIYTLVPTDETLFAPFLPPFAPAGTLKLVTGPGAGFDKISMPYFNEHKIKYCNTPGSVAEPTALHAVRLAFFPPPSRQ